MDRPRGWTARATGVAHSDDARRPSPSLPRVTTAPAAHGGPSAFDEATAVRRVGPGRYAAAIDPSWSIEGRANGGYVLAVATRAALLEAGDGHVHPLAVTGAFAATAPDGPVAVQVEAVRRGRATSLLRVRLAPGSGEAGRDGEDRPAFLEALVTAGRLADGEPVLPGPPPPAMPAEEDCPRAHVDAGPMHVPLLGRISERLDPATAGFALGRPAGIGELRAWVRFDDGREPDPLALTCLADCLPPPTFDLPRVQVGWVPTLQYSVFVRAVPAPGALLARTVARSVGAGAVDETCDLWDAGGRLVAVGHQLAAVRPA